jgi:hypothetical protein
VGLKAELSALMASWTAALTPGGSTASASKKL